MRMNNVIDDISRHIREKGLLPINKPYSLIQENLGKCKLVVEHILKQKCENVMYKVDTSEYFNLVVIRIDCNEINYNNSLYYMDICKKFKETFTESGVEVNVALFLGDLDSNNYKFSMLY